MVAVIVLMVVVVAAGTAGPVSVVVVVVVAVVVSSGMVTVVVYTILVLVQVVRVVVDSPSKEWRRPEEMMALPQPLRKSGITISLSCNASRRITTYTDAGGGGVKTGLWSVLWSSFWWGSKPCMPIIGDIH